MGSQVQVYTDITFSDGSSSNHWDANTNAMNVSQDVVATIVRKFTNTGSAPITVDLTAEFTGTIDFDSFNYDYATDTITNPDTYAYYILDGTASVTEFAPIQGMTTFTANLDNSQWSDTFTDILINPDSDGTYYTLATTLTVNTFVKNWTVGMVGFQAFSLDGDFFIGGDSNDPFTMTATIPVPPSVFLLLSGLGGLVFARRRFRDGWH